MLPLVIFLSLTARAVHGAVSRCSSDIHHLKLVEDNIESQSLDLIDVGAGGGDRAGYRTGVTDDKREMLAYVLLTVFW